MPGRMAHPKRIALVDVDGTLVDTNYQHALAWYRAFRAHDLVFPLWRIHRHIGMGGDQLVPALAGTEVERSLGDRLRAAWEKEFEAFRPEISAVPGATELLESLGADGSTTVLASSGKPEHVEAFMELVHAHGLVAAWTTSEDVSRTKPYPDLLEVALEKAGDASSVDGAEVVMIGDSTWDCEAARRLGVRSLALLTGGFSEEELRAAGAAEVFAALPDLTATLTH